MAIMIPEKPRTFDPKSREDLIFSALENLPDDYYVLHSFQINKIKEDNSLFEGEGDFVIFNRYKGILVLEAKATRAYYSQRTWYYGSGKEMQSGGPFEQARRAMHAIKNRMEKQKMNDIVSRCKFLYAVWFPLVDAAYIRALNLPMEVSADQIITMEALYDPETYIDRMYSFTDHEKTETNLSDAQARRVINEVLCPEFDIAPAAGIDVDIKHLVFHKLLKEQSAVLNFLDEQRTAVINGAAGTGKTLVAVEKAKRHARRGEKVLFLCFNSQLKDYLSENFADENIEYSTIAGFACRLCHTPKPDYDALERLLMTMWENKSFPYRHVIVDEGQDFGSDDIAEVLETMKSIIEETTEDGSFYVFYDKLQLIQARKLPPFLADADCKLTLYRNCRNTENIAKTSLGPISDRAPKLIENCLVGAPAKLHYCSNADSVLAEVDGVIDGLFSDEVRDIVILTCKTENDSILTPHLVNGGYPAGKKSIRFTTCRKFKGLEADAVILVDVDKTTFTGNDGQNVLLYYVGTSRARLRLDVIAQLDDSDCLAILEALGKAGKAKRPRRDLARALNAVAQIAD